MGSFLLVGMGQTNKALARAIKANGGELVAVDDMAAQNLESLSAELDVEIHSQPTSAQLKTLAKKCEYCIPTPGLSDGHPIYKAMSKKTKLMSELDYAASLTQAPIVAVTGTNGKTTVVTLVRDALVAAGKKAIAAGNIGTPFSQAVLEHPDSEVFVVEASSFGLRHAQSFSPNVAAWLNFAPNHLDKHSSLKAYEESKAKIWARIGTEDSWVANSEDPIVWKNRPQKGKQFAFKPSQILAKQEVGSSGYKYLNFEAVKAIATAAGASSEAIVQGIENFKGLPHRMELIAELKGVKWFNDSKATTPHAVMAGLQDLPRTILIAGGRDKSNGLGSLKELSNLKAVVAVGEAAQELTAIFKGHFPIGVAESMAEAVFMANILAEKNDVVVLSPGCASFDWYGSYEQRGEDFKKKVNELLEDQK